MKDWKKAEDVAAERMQLVAPLLADGLDAAKVKTIKEQICQQTGLSERTIRRYVTEYRARGFEGLKPRGKIRDTKPEPIPSQVLEQAIVLRREVPGRSISQIIEILEWEGKVPRGKIKRSTLQEKLAQRVRMN